MRPINEIIVHCTATRADWWQSKPTKSKVNEVRRWHVEDRKWKNIGYHYLVDRDGTVAKGRPVEQVGAHCRGHNSGTIGISLFGGHGSSENDSFEDNFTPAQDAALRDLIAELSRTYGINKVTGHNQYAAKACPGFNVSRWLNRKPAPVERTRAAQSKTVQASAVTIASGAGAAVSAVSALDSTAQYIVLGFAGVIVLAGLFIMRERLRKWGQGDR